MTAVADRIGAELARIEVEHDVRIILAVESGSRAWGFASTDSDYDVRFIYVHRRDWYLSIQEERRDVIELPIVDELDINGWDLRKALRLLRKSNPPLLEWLHSPIVYRYDPLVIGLVEAVPRYYSPRATFLHYLHMARGNVREYLRGDVVWLKKYFYVLRPLLAMRWIERGLDARGGVPVEFDALVESTLDDPSEATVRAAIADLLAAKRGGQELDRGPRIAALSDFIDAELAGNQPNLERVEQPGTDELDRVFRAIVDAR